MCVFTRVFCVHGARIRAFRTAYKRRKGRFTAVAAAPKDNWPFPKRIGVENRLGGQLTVLHRFLDTPAMTEYPPPREVFTREGTRLYFRDKHEGRCR